ncbi:MAG TPA: nicotinate-nucleotide--dimethylbenzimidazole phosphoribosyltransferase [Actinocrinis sp.]|uniref:nicotinate-nucleotide--dimethylbenzimidazole phosphoribosyltransferase n=1 Tax=Actinocrinis sp. TaxID=1920516 RepID=UPI002DDCBCEB|nr:nicotinate-nucleotide--dimethylbenzimidazole phosphoribosyltransferase [Actinocrinis sp.]HEV2343374.1 nicotinate-nucleotide--dimethylbenzimidazole phosphoribosyltransferase [Actinocrinis sp.]
MSGTEEFGTGGYGTGDTERAAADAGPGGPGRNAPPTGPRVHVPGEPDQGAAVGAVNGAPWLSPGSVPYAEAMFGGDRRGFPDAAQGPAAPHQAPGLPGYPEGYGTDGYASANGYGPRPTQSQVPQQRYDAAPFDSGFTQQARYAEQQQPQPGGYEHPAAGAPGAGYGPGPAYEQQLPYQSGQYPTHTAHPGYDEQTAEFRPGPLFDEPTLRPTAPPQGQAMGAAGGINGRGPVPGPSPHQGPAGPAMGMANGVQPQAAGAAQRPSMSGSGTWTAAPAPAAQQAQPQQQPQQPRQQPTHPAAAQHPAGPHQSQQVQAQQQSVSGPGAAGPVSAGARGVEPGAGLSGSGVSQPPASVSAIPRVPSPQAVGARAAQPAPGGVAASAEQRVANAGGSNPVGALREEQPRGAEPGYGAAPLPPRPALPDEPPPGPSPLPVRPPRAERQAQATARETLTPPRRAPQQQQQQQPQAVAPHPSAPQPSGQSQHVHGPALQNPAADLTSERMRSVAPSVPAPRAAAPEQQAAVQSPAPAQAAPAAPERRLSRSGSFNTLVEPHGDADEGDEMIVPWQAAAVPPVVAEPAQAPAAAPVTAPQPDDEHTMRISDMDADMLQASVHPHQPPAAPRQQQVQPAQQVSAQQPEHPPAAEHEPAPTPAAPQAPVQTQTQSQQAAQQTHAPSPAPESGNAATVPAPRGTRRRMPEPAAAAAASVAAPTATAAPAARIAQSPSAQAPAAATTPTTIQAPAQAAPASVSASVAAPAPAFAPTATASAPAPVPAPSAAPAPATAQTAVDAEPDPRSYAQQAAPAPAPQQPAANTAVANTAATATPPAPQPQPQQPTPPQQQHQDDQDSPAPRQAQGEEPDDDQIQPVGPDGLPRAAAYDEEALAAVYRVIHERRDVRNDFLPDEVPTEVLTRILEAAHTAPSVGLSQPWDFLVIRDHAMRQRVHELAVRQRRAYAASLPKARARAFAALKVEAILDTPVNIVVTCDPTRGGRHTLGRYTQPMMAPFSSCLAVENLWLASRAEGLGVGWVSFFDERELAAVLDLPDHLQVVAYLCVGYVKAFPAEPELAGAGWAQRRPLAWAVHEERFGHRALPGAQPISLLSETVDAIRGLDPQALAEARDRQARMTKPPGSLGALEALTEQLAGLAGVCPPPLPEPAALAVFAADHGVHAQGVTPWPQEVTAQMVANFLAGGAVVNAFAKQVGAEVCVVDVGVAADLAAHSGLIPRKIRYGTADMTQGPALTREETVAALEAGIETARDLVAAGNRCLLTGDMGIANTTASAALIAAFTGASPAQVTGYGTGIDEQTYAHKVEVVGAALELHRPDPQDPVGVLCAFGGLEHAALAGFILGAAALRVPVVLDGVIAGAAALVAQALSPEVTAACVAGHRSAEPGHALALEALGITPLIDLELRLGEGSGAALALPLVGAAVRALREVATFDDAGVSDASSAAVAPPTERERA